MSDRNPFKIMRAPAEELLASYGIVTKKASERGVIWLNMAKCPACGHDKYQCGVSESFGIDGKLVHGVHCFHPSDNPWGKDNIPYEDFLEHIGALTADQAEIVRGYTTDPGGGNKGEGFRISYASQLQKRLFKNPAAIEYLMGRGLFRPTIERFYLGLSKEYVNKNTGEVKADALVCPIMARNGRFTKRNLYYNIPGVTQNPINENGWMKGDVSCFYADRVDQQRAIFICEGLKDVWVNWQYLNMEGLLPDILLVSSTHGSAVPDEWQKPGFWKHWEAIYCGQDNDSAGELMAIKIARFAGRPVQRVKVPPELGKDWTDFWKNGGTIKQFKELLEDAPNLAAEDETISCTPNEFGRLSFDPVDINGTYHGGYLYYPVQTLLREKETSIEGTGGEEEVVVERLEDVVIRSDRTVHTAIESKAKRGTNRNQKIWRLTDGTLIESPPRPNSYSTWEWHSINKYLTGKTQSRPLKAILQDVYRHLMASIWLPYDEDYSLLTLVVPVTFAQFIFDAVPLLMANGPAGSGKSQLGISMSHLCANGTIIGQTSAASIARLIDETRGFVVLDDLESLGSKKGQEAAAFSELAQALKLSYNKATAKKIWTDVKTMKTERLNFFGVKLINNTQGVDEILGSRMLHIQTRRMPPDVYERFHSQSAASIERLHALRNELHTWTFENVELIAIAYSDLFPKRTDRSDEITAPLKVFAELSEDDELKASFYSALAMQRRKLVRPDDPVEVLWEAMRNIIIQGYDWVMPSHVINEMKTMMPESYDQESTTQIPEWQRPGWIGKQLRLFDLIDQKSPGDRFRIKGSNLRAYPIKREVIEEVSTWAKDQGVEIKEPGSTPVTGFCLECESCTYRAPGCVVMEKMATGYAPTGSMQLARKMEKIRGKQSKVV